MAKALLGCFASIVLVTVAGCAAPSHGDPEAAGYFPYYDRGIDQDIATTHDAGVPLSRNFGSTAATRPWQTSERPLFGR